MKSIHTTTAHSFRIEANRLVLFILFSALSFSVAGQRIWTVPVGPYVYNPGGANINDMGEIVASYYSTYLNANNHPQGALVMGSTSLPFDNMGAGARLDYQSGGVLKNVTFEATYVYKVNIGTQNKLSFGLSAVYNQIGIDMEKVHAQHANDPLLVKGANSEFGIDFNVGVMLYKPNHYYIGLAGYNLAGSVNDPDFLIAYDLRDTRLLTASGMYTFHGMEGNLNTEITGNLLSYVDWKEFDPVFNLNLREIIYKTLWVGCGYTKNMILPQMGIYFQNLSIGYASSWGVHGDIKKYAYKVPRHEIFMRLELNTSKNSKNLRF